MSKSGITRKSTAKGKAVGTRLQVARSAATGSFLATDADSGKAVQVPGSGKAAPNKMRRVSRTQPSGKPAKTAPATDKWSAFDKLDVGDIEGAGAADPDAAPIDDDDFWKNAHVVMPVPKQAISIRIDADVLAFFKGLGPGYQGRINAVLRSYMEAKT